MSVSNEPLNEALVLDKLKRKIIELLKAKQIDMEMELTKRVLANTTNRDFLSLYMSYEEKISQAEVLLNSPTEILSLKDRIEIYKALKTNLKKQVHAFGFLNDDITQRQSTTTQTAALGLERATEISKKIKDNLEQQLRTFGVLITTPRSEETKTKLDKEQMSNPITSDFEPEGQATPKPEETKTKVDQEQTGKTIVKALTKALKAIGAGFRWIARPKAFGSWVVKGFKSLFAADISTDKNKKQTESTEAHDPGFSSNTTPISAELGALTTELNSKRSTSHMSATSHPQVVIHTSLDPSSPPGSTQVDPPAPNAKATKPNND